jgi:hypothetical protein
LTVTRAPLTITANNTNKVYGAALPTFTANYSGLVNGNTPASLDTPVSLTTTATAGSAVGTYPITASGAVDANYTITFVNGTLTVTRAPLTITANNTNKVYGAALPTFTATYSGLVNGDTPASLDHPVILTTTATTGSPVGSYPITGNGAAVPSLASYAFDEGSGVVARDSSGNGFDASLVGGVQWVQGHSGSALSFDGVSSYAQVPSTAALNFGENNSFTIAGWVRSSPGYSTTSMLLSKETSLTGAGFGLWNLNTSTSRLYARLEDTDGDQSGWLVNGNGPYINDGGWHHVAMVVDRAQHQVALYTDGITSPPYDLATMGNDGIGDLSNAAAFTIGGSPYNYEGDIDDVRLYGAALSEQQIQSLYSDGAPVPPPVDSNYTINFVDGTLTIDRAATTGVIVSSANPALPAQEITFTSVLTALAPGAGTPTGNVKFLVDGLAGAIAPLSNGSASFSTATLQLGIHTVVAEYAGDGNFTGSTNTLTPEQVINTPPIALNDTIERYPTNGVNVELTTLLANDNDSDGDLLMITVSSNSAAGGTITVSGGVAFYIPPAGYTNSDSFTYRIADGRGGEATATVTVNIQGEPPQILTISHLDNGTCRLRLNGVSGRSYTFQYTDELNPGNWHTLSTGTANPLGVYEYVDTPPAELPARFYRSMY